MCEIDKGFPEDTQDVRYCYCYTHACAKMDFLGVTCSEGFLIEVDAPSWTALDLVLVDFVGVKLEVCLSAALLGVLALDFVECVLV